MGVTGLWTVVQPCARPIKLETLNKKRLAVDASIWIYQFLKAVRDKEGNALRNSHVVGFFRRICKLLFFGIKPVFVFDGGAPALKRQTVSGRKARREGRREDAVRTAGKLLAVQMQRRAEEEDRRRREEKIRHDGREEMEEEEMMPENMVYVDELQMTAQERQQNRQFKKKDAYHLPDLDVSLENLGAPNDPRIMSHEELEEYARQFHTGEDVNVYDFSKIDFNSSFFLSLPASDRYNILNAARLRSRLRMGYSKEQLDTMFPDRMAFSKFQVERVRERNELTQRLMNINGMNGDDAMFGINGPGRVAGEKGKEYVLVKNDGVEGGWALGVVSNKGEGERNKPIDVEGIGRDVNMEENVDSEWEDDGFEDVPIEGLNRLPKRIAPISPSKSKDILGRQRVSRGEKPHTAGHENTSSQEPVNDDSDSLFLPQQRETQQQDANRRAEDDLFEDAPSPGGDDQDDLQRAIAMSLESPDLEGSISGSRDGTFSPTYLGPRIDQPLDFNKRNAQVGRSFAHTANARASKANKGPFEEEDYSDEDDFSLPAALAESRSSKHQPQGARSPYKEDRPRTLSTKEKRSPVTASPDPKSAQQKTGFDGPLPFESLDLGKSKLSKKKQPPEEAGGFEKEPEKKAQPLPPWFAGNVVADTAAQRAIENHQHYPVNTEHSEMSREEERVLRRQETGEVIDLDAPRNQADEIIEVESSENDEDVVMRKGPPVDPEIRMDDIADLVRAEPQRSHMPHAISDPVLNEELQTPERNHSEDEEELEWEESDYEQDVQKSTSIQDSNDLTSGNIRPNSSKSQSPELEDARIIGSSTEPPKLTAAPGSAEIPSLPISDSFDQITDNVMPVEQDDYSDPEDDDLMRQLAIEAEEHARFASTLNSRSSVQNAEDYERELRQLRSQQKKDRRDADEVSHIMITECQQLLKFFGLPYVTAPMEAEAQCAELVSLGLVDGIVTDDSDIFLFGGTRVYKNMFNQAKFVECYLSTDLEKEYSLDRHKLIRIAHLLGSDYTEGLPSIGPVTALEILSEFETLEDFKAWWSAVQTGQRLTSPEDTNSSFRRKFKRNASKLFLPPTFPDLRVDHAYLHPDVDSDPSAFQWGVPDLDALRQYLMATIGWSQERTDEVLVPVIRDMNRREQEGTQANITHFFGGTVGLGSMAGNGGQGTGNGGHGEFAPRRRKEGKSRRMESALGRLHKRAKNRTRGEGEEETSDIHDAANEAREGDDKDTQDGMETISAQPKTKSKDERGIIGECDGVINLSEGNDEEYQAPKKSRKRTIGAKPMRRNVKTKS